MKTPRYDRLVNAWLSKQQTIVGEVHQFTVLHDDWCRMLNRKGDCNCNPEFSFKPHPVSDASFFELHLRQGSRREDN